MYIYICSTSFPDLPNFGVSDFQLSFHPAPGGRPRVPESHRPVAGSAASQLAALGRGVQLLALSGERTRAIFPPRLGPRVMEGGDVP